MMFECGSPAVEELKYSPELLHRLGLSAEGKGGQVFQHHRTKLILVVQWKGSGQDTYDTLSIYGSGVEYPIRLKQKSKTNGKIFTTYVIQSKVPLRPHEVVRLEIKGGELLAAYTRANQNRDFGVTVEDETKPIKPRSIAKLKKLLKIFESTVEKSFYSSPVMELFVPALFTRDEAKIFDEHIQKTGGKGISLVSLLFFKLGLEKYRYRIGKSAGDDS